MNSSINVSIDLGGVVTRCPDVFVPLIIALASSPAVNLFVLTDMAMERTRVILREHRLDELFDDDHILCADWERHGELCKVVLRQQLGIRLHIDDLLAYAQHTALTDGTPSLGLVLMPSSLPYTAVMSAAIPENS